MKKKDITNYLLSDKQIENINLKYRIDTEVGNEIETITTNLIDQKCKQLNVNYEELEDSCSSMIYLDIMYQNAQASMTVYIIFGCLLTFSGLLMVFNNPMFNIIIPIVVLSIGVLLILAALKKIKLINIIINNLKNTKKY